jgi:hydrogenase-1 operon protein HyaF
MPPLPAELPAGTMNAPAVLDELRERSHAWQRGDAGGDGAHVVNLTLLPLTPADSLLFEQQLGRGQVMVLSRGYGNCRVVDTRVAGVWRVTYFNSQDMILLDTLEVGDVPEVACAARQDLEDSAERLAEVLRWVEDA